MSKFRVFVSSLEGGGTPVTGFCVPSGVIVHSVYISPKGCWAVFDYAGKNGCVHWWEEKSPLLKLESIGFWRKEISKSGALNAEPFSNEEQHLQEEMVGLIKEVRQAVHDGTLLAKGEG